MTRVAVVRFPGSNCDMDALRAARGAGCDAYFVWHRDDQLSRADTVILPGGFSYGDYLRSGAIARFSPIMRAVRQHADAGGPVLGICNGFQILCEAGLLPGGLLPNSGLTFVSRPVPLRVENCNTPFTLAYRKGESLRIPVAHGEGRFVAAPEVVEQLEASGRIVLRYQQGGNPNGSVADIAGICSSDGNVVGLMPHPERVFDPVIGDTPGSGFFASLVQWHTSTSNSRTTQPA